MNEDTEMYLEKLIELIQESLTTTVRFARIESDEGKMRAQDACAYSMGLLKELDRLLHS